jgi:hypothetical protein
LRDRISRIEALIQRDAGRGMNAVFQATRGGLFSAATALAAMPSPRVGLITGFFVPDGDPPAAETDGPGGAALLARGLTEAGVVCRLATDTICASACRAALDAAGAAAVPIDAVNPVDAVRSLIECWRAEKIDWVIAIERCGASADGKPYNMRGTDISATPAPLDKLFVAGPWRTIGIGDGGNELGMGCIPRPLLTQQVPLGKLTGCTIPAEYVITAGVSHWGAYALLTAIGIVRPAWARATKNALNPDLDRHVIETMVCDGPAVDGITLRREATIDALDMETHRQMLLAIFALGVGI